MRDEEYIAYVDKQQRTKRASSLNNMGTPDPKVVKEWLYDHCLRVGQDFWIKDTLRDTYHQEDNLEQDAFFVNDKFHLHRKSHPDASSSNSIMWKLLRKRYLIARVAATTKLGVNFKGVGQPSEKMVECMKWICHEFPMRQDLEEFDEGIWWDYTKAHKFIGANIDRAKEHRNARAKERGYTGPFRDLDSEYIWVFGQKWNRDDPGLIDIGEDLDPVNGPWGPIDTDDLPF